MSIDKLKRDLISCGKDFFIDNFYEIKRYTDGSLTKDELDSIIKSKDKWNSISTLGNRISAIKMIFKNNQEVDALKITIGSRAKGDVTIKAKEIFESELGRKYDETSDEIENISNTHLIPEITEALNSKLIQELCVLEDFQYQKGTDKLIEFENYNALSKDEISTLLKRFKDSNSTFTKFIETLNKDSKEYHFLTLTGQFVSYCDVHAANKNIYNEYEDKRTIAKAGVRMNHWIDKLLSYKIEDNDLEKLTPSIKNAIIFLKNPELGLTMLSENHRKKFSRNLLHKTYDPESIADDLITFFEPYKIDVENEENRTSVYCSVLYSKNVNQLWLNDDNNEVSEEKPETKNTNDMKIPLNQIFYGPPGTGKTYNISSEAEKIIKEKWSKPLSKKEKFKTICRELTTKFPYEDKSNSIYRNERAAIWMLGWIIKYSEFNDTNTIEKQAAILKGFKPGSSSWSQRSQFLSHFRFSSDWKHSTKIELNDSGIELKEKAIQFMTENNLTPDHLAYWKIYNNLIPEGVNIKYADTKDLSTPDFVIDAYFKNISEQYLDSCAPSMKSLFCTLNYLINEPTFSSREDDWENADDEIREKVNIYFDPKQPDGDLKWVGHFGRILFGLGFLDNSEDNYKLNDKGAELIHEIIENWNIKFPELFEGEINYDIATRQGFIEFITFHQSYSYEEFIEGIRPDLDGENNLNYSLEPGVFKRISDNAKQDLDNNYVIIIDEINRGNISKIFGELITLIEPSKRLFSDDPKEHPKQVTLPYSKKLFGVPKNLYILGTMNTADKSIALLDSALRRRFSFTEMLPNSEVVGQNIAIDNVNVKTLFETINSRIEFLIDKDHTIGHSYFLKIQNNQTIEALALIFKNEIIPLLTEYFYGDFEKIQLVLGDNKEWESKSENKFFNKKSSQQNSLFGTTDIDGYDDKDIFELTPLLDINNDGNINGNQTQLTELFKSVYTKEIN